MFIPWSSYDDKVLNRWYTNVSISSLCKQCRQFKQQLCFKKYLYMPNARERISLTKYRCTNSKFAIYNPIYLYDSALCILCNLNSTCAEYHYIMIYPFFRKERELYYFIMPIMHKFVNLFCSTNKRTQRCLAVNCRKLKLRNKTNIMSHKQIITRIGNIGYL